MKTKCDFNLLTAPIYWTLHNFHTGFSAPQLFFFPQCVSACVYQRYAVHPSWPVNLIRPKISDNFLADAQALLRSQEHRSGESELIFSQRLQRSEETSQHLWPKVTLTPAGCSLHPHRPPFFFPSLPFTGSLLLRLFCILKFQNLLFFGCTTVSFRSPSSTPFLHFHSSHQKKGSRLKLFHQFCSQTAKMEQKVTFCY